MSKELLLVAEAVANEKGVDRGVIFDALEAALASAAKKQYPEEDVQMRVSINRATGNYDTFRMWEVVADDVVMESPHHQIRLMDAVDIKADAQVGDLADHVEDLVELGAVAGRAPGRPEADPAHPGVLGPAGDLHHLGPGQHRRGVDPGLVPGRLGAVGAILRTTPGLDRDQLADLHLAGVVVLAMDGRGAEDQFQEGFVVDRLQLGEGPVVADGGAHSSVPGSARGGPHHAPRPGRL